MLLDKKYYDINYTRRKQSMAKRTFTQEKKNPKHTNVWEWEETPEVLKALENLHKNTPKSDDG